MGGVALGAVAFGMINALTIIKAHIVPPEN